MSENELEISENPVEVNRLAEAPPPEENSQDDNYFYLSEPIVVDGRSIDKLLVNPKSVLTGKQFFAVINRYNRKFPEEARSSFNKYVSENFLSLVLAEINKIAPEDLYKVSYADLPLLFLQATSFHFAGGRKATTPAKNGE